MEVLLIRTCITSVWKANYNPPWKDAYIINFQMEKFTRSGKLYLAAAISKSPRSSPGNMFNGILNRRNGDFLLWRWILLRSITFRSTSENAVYTIPL